MATKQKSLVAEVVAHARQLADDVDGLDLGENVAWVYNPLQYAWKAHHEYLKRFTKSSCQVLFLGMNPGPWGMAQTGVPFGEVDAVQRFLGITAEIGKPEPEHPKRPVTGFECTRSEVSGRRLWGLFESRFASADAFFADHFVTNYCPLVFMEESGRNLTPDKLPADARRKLEEVCDRHLARLIDSLQPTWLIGIGGFAEKCLARVAPDSADRRIEVGRILHPSPASPAANRDWSGTATRQLQDLGIW